MINILYLGDIVGSAGRETLKSLLPSLKRKYRIDLCLANAENIAHGRGATKETIQEVQSYGVDFFTSGNHIFRFRQFTQELDNKEIPILRPANYPAGVPGRGFQVIDLGKKGKVLLINLIGRAFFRENHDCPFKMVDQILKDCPLSHFEAIVVDLHAEATSEKIAMGFYLDGRASLIVGTHTHVPTSDQRILPKGTGYISDLGMVGAQNSVLGVKTEIVIEFQKLQIPCEFQVEEEGPKILSGIVATIDSKKLTKKIDLIQKIIE